MRLAELLCEKIIDRHPTITLNPSRAEYRALQNSVEAWWRPIHANRTDAFPIRALLDIQKNDLYVWDAYDATHGAIIDRYGISQGVHLMINNKLVRVLTLWRYERMGYSHDIEEMLRTNPKLHRIIGSDLEIEIEP